MSDHKPVYLPIVRDVEDRPTLQELLGNDWGLQMCAEAFAVAELLEISVELSDGVSGDEGK